MRGPAELLEREEPEARVRIRSADGSPAPSATLAVVNLFDGPLMEARASASSRYSCRWTSSYFRVFMNDSQYALS